MPGMIASKLALIIVTFRPITSPSAFTMSGSIPMIVCPSEAMHSFGAYCASVATLSVPFDLVAAGTSLATDATAPLDVGALVDVVVAVEAVLLLVLLLPQPASARTVSASIPVRATILLIGPPQSS